MSTIIRLSRVGTKKRPFYHIVVTNSRSPRDSKFIEKIGTYNPLLADNVEKRLIINTERAKHWLSVGAELSDRVHLFFNRTGIVATKPAQRAARMPRKKDKTVAVEGAPAAAPAAEAAAPEAAAPETAA